MNTVNPRSGTRFGQHVRIVVDGMAMIARLIAPPLLRIALALPFFRSGLTRWDGFLSLSAGTLYLFENQFKLHILGGVYDFPMPDQLALVVATAEILLPILLVLGLATRFAALGLLIMTGAIQLVFPDGWAKFSSLLGVSGCRHHSARLRGAFFRLSDQFLVSLASMTPCRDTWIVAPLRSSQ